LDRWVLQKPDYPKQLPEQPASQPLIAIMI
jgi:hypothetical protein